MLGVPGGFTGGSSGRFGGGSSLSRIVRSYGRAAIGPGASFRLALAVLREILLNLAPCALFD